MCRYACDVESKYAISDDYDNTAINQARIKSKI